MATLETRPFPSVLDTLRAFPATGKIARLTIYTLEAVRLVTIRVAQIALLGTRTRTGVPVISLVCPPALNEVKAPSKARGTQTASPRMGPP